MATFFDEQDKTKGELKKITVFKFEFYYFQTNLGY